MTRRTILTAIGRDRPGLVEEVSEFVLARNGSIEDSRMANMLGQFAIVMLVAGPPEALEAIVRDVDALAAATGVHATFASVEQATPAPAQATHRFEARALDQPGLVHEVADVFRRLGVNIETLETRLESAPVTGSPVFAMTVVVAVPEPVAVDDLERELGTACDRLNITWTLAPEGAAAATA